MVKFITIVILSLVSLSQLTSVQISLAAPQQELSDSMNDNDKVINYVGSFAFPEKYNKRCLTSTKLDIPKDMEPKLIFIQQGSSDKDIHLNYDSSDEEFAKTGFNPGRRTIIFVHGWDQSPHSEYLIKTRSLLQRLNSLSQANYIMFDWSKAAKIAYTNGAARTSGIGNFLAVFIERLTILGLDRNKLHVISHSAGVPISGFAGKRLNPKIGRITGLDPAGPCFGHYILNGHDDRLTSGDAEQVDIYHYDDILGLTDKTADFDIIVNGGKNQPGCPQGLQVAFEAFIAKMKHIKQPLSPSHTRSSMVPTVQLEEGKCQQVAYECESYESFLRGECADCGPNDEQCFVMSFPFQYASHPEPIQANLRHRDGDPRKRKAFHIVLNNNEKFCSNLYQVLINFEPSARLISAASTGNWKLSLEFIYEFDGKTKSVEIETSNKLRDGVFSNLLSLDDGPVKIISAHLLVNKGSIGLRGEELFVGLKKSTEYEKFIKTSFKLEDIQINYMSNIDSQVRAKFSSRLCPGESSSFKNNKGIELQQCK